MGKTQDVAAKSEMSATRQSTKALLDQTFPCGITIAAVALAVQALYVFFTGNWTLAEGIATTAKLLAIAGVTYFARIRLSR